MPECNIAEGVSAPPSIWLDTLLDSILDSVSVYAGEVKPLLNAKFSP